MNNDNDFTVFIFVIGISFGLLISLIFPDFNTGQPGDDWMPHPFYGTHLHINCDTITRLAATAYADAPLWMDRPEYEDRFVTSFIGQFDVEIQTCKEYNKGEK